MSSSPGHVDQIQNESRLPIHTRVAAACTNCRRCKARCDAEEPCGRCQVRPHLGPCFYEPVTPEQNEATKRRRAELSQRKRQGLPRNSGPQSIYAPSSAVNTPDRATTCAQSSPVPASASPSRQYHPNYQPDPHVPISGISPHPVPSPGRRDSRHGRPPELQHVFIMDESGPDSSARQSIEGQELDIGHVYVRDAGIQVGSPRLAFRQPVQEPTLGLKTRTVGTQAPALLPAAPRHSCPPQRQLASTQEEQFLQQYLQQLRAQYWSHVQRRGQDQKRRLSQPDSFAEESSKKLRHLTSAQMQQQRPPFPSQQQQPLAPRKQISPFPYRPFPTKESPESPQKSNMTFAEEHQERRITAEEEYDQARRHTLDQYHQKVVSAVLHQQDLQECKAPAVAAAEHSHQGSPAKERKPEVNSAPSDARTSLKRSSSPSVLHKDAVLAPPRKLPKDVPAFAVERYRQWLGATQRQPGWPIGQRARRYSA